VYNVIFFIKHIYVELRTSVCLSRNKKSVLASQPAGSTLYPLTQPCTPLSSTHGCTSAQPAGSTLYLQLNLGHRRLLIPPYIHLYTIVNPPPRSSLALSPRVENDLKICLLDPDLNPSLPLGNRPPHH